MTTRSRSTSSSRRLMILCGALALIGLIYALLLPRLRQVAAETAQQERRNAAAQAEETRLKQLKSALDVARQKAQQQPQNAQAQLEMAKRSEEAGRSVEALQYARAAARLQPNNLETLLSLAELSRHARDYDTALTAYRSALNIAPTDPRALTGLGALYVLIGWPAQAEGLLAPAVHAAPDVPQLQVALALVYVQQENYAPAERLLQALRAAHPEDVSLWSPLIDLYLRSKRYAEALTTVQDALKLTPDAAPLLSLQAEIYYRLDQIPAAVAACRHLLALDAENVSAHYFLGLCYAQTDRPDDAMQQFEQVMQQAPDYKLTRKILGKQYLRIHRTEDGERLLADSKRIEEAGQQIRRLSYFVAIRPDDAEIHRRMATLYQREHDLPRAIVEWRRVLELAPGDQRAAAMLAQARQATGINAE